MDFWERAKVGASLVLACGTWAACYWLGGTVMAPHYPQQQGFPIAGVPPVDLAAAQRDWPAGGDRAERQELLGYVSHIDKAIVPVAAAAAAPVDAPVDLPTLLATAEPERGRRAAQACMACHDVSENGPDRIGPNLWGVVDRPVASRAGFAYSAALKRQGGQWTFEDLDHFLSAPARAIPGTKMGFAGLRNPHERANVLAFLASLKTGRSSP